MNFDGFTEDEINLDKTPSEICNKSSKLKIDWFMVFNATFNNISVISWRPVLLVEETRIPRENHQPVVSH